MLCEYLLEEDDLSLVGSSSMLPGGEHHDTYLLSLYLDTSDDDDGCMNE